MFAATKTIYRGKLSIVEEAPRNQVMKYVPHLINGFPNTCAFHEIPAFIRATNCNCHNVVKLVEYGYDSYNQMSTMLFPRLSDNLWGLERGRIGAIGDLVIGLASLHSHGIAHCDIKPQNYMIDDRGHAVFIDLGNSRINMEKTTFYEPFHPTTYQAPESLLHQPFIDPFKTDVFALGILAIELLGTTNESLSPLGQDCTTNQILKRETSLFHNGDIINVVDEPNDYVLNYYTQMESKSIGDMSFNPDRVYDGMTEDAQDFVQRACDLNPQNRAQIFELMKHPLIVRYCESRLNNNEFPKWEVDTTIMHVPIRQGIVPALFGMPRNLIPTEMDVKGCSLAYHLLTECKMNMRDESLRNAMRAVAYSVIGAPQQYTTQNIWPHVWGYLLNNRDLMTLLSHKIIFE